MWTFHLYLMYKILLFLLLSTVAYAQNVTRMATASGTNTYTCTFNPNISSFNPSTVYVIKFTNGNTSGAVTLDPAGAVAATAIKDNAGANLELGAIKAGGSYSFIFDGTNLRVMGGLTDSQGNNITWNTKTSNYTPVATDTLFSDPGFLMRSASAISFTVPPFATTDFSVGTSFLVYNDSTGTLSILEGSGVDFESVVAGPWTLAEDEYAVIVKSNSTDTWKLMVGNPGGGGMTNPMTTAADVIVGGSSGTPARLAAGTALQYLRMNAGATALEWATFAGGGITNGAANTELTMSDGTNLDPSGIFIPSAGSINLGTGLTGSNRTITAAGSATDIDLTLASKGTSSTYIQTPNLYAWNTENFYVYGTAPTLWMGQPGVATATIAGNTGQVSGINGAGLVISGGNAYTVSGNGNGGSLTFSSGNRRSAGSGTDGNFNLDPNLGWVTMTNESLTPGALTNQIAFYSQDVSSSAELFVKNEAGVVAQLSGYRRELLDLDAADAGNVGTGEDVIYTYTLPAGKLAVNEQTLRIRAAISFAANGNTKRIKVKFGSVSVVDPGAGAVSGTAVIDCQIIRTGAATQKCNCSVTALSGTHAVLSDITETLSGTVVIQITGEAVSNNDIIKESASVTYEP